MPASGLAGACRLCGGSRAAVPVLREAGHLCRTGSGLAGGAGRAAPARAGHPARDRSGAARAGRRQPPGGGAGRAAPGMPAFCGLVRLQALPRHCLLPWRSAFFCSAGAPRGPAPPVLPWRKYAFRFVKPRLGPNGIRSGGMSHAMRDARGAPVKCRTAGQMAAAARFCHRVRTSTLPSETSPSACTSPRRRSGPRKVCVIPCRRSRLYGYWG